MAKSVPIEAVDESVVAHTAKILGPQSAAQRALDDAAGRRASGQEVIFCKSGATLLVVQKSAIAEP